MVMIVTTATVRPIERAEPSIIFIAASIVSQLRSFHFLLRRFLDLRLGHLADQIAAGVFEPLSSLAAFLRKKDTGGVLSSGT